jgi:CspA family cold shock protein
LARGRVDWYSPYLGQGFIVPEDEGPKAFVRREDLTPGEKDLENNDEVIYEMAEGIEGPEARNVSRV